jgi:acyl-CoA reductase-like NAD-dependent aldehyde dehydrogenase
VTGVGETAGAPLTEHPGVRLVSFTGSTDTGRVVAENAARAGKICSLEMGGKNVIMVMEDADLDLAAARSGPPGNDARRRHGSSFTNASTKSSSIN